MPLDNTNTYDAHGQLTSITDALSHVTTLAYNPAGLIASVTDAQSHVTQYQYDARGNHTSVTDALGNQTTFAYDLMNRLTQILSHHPSPSFPDISLFNPCSAVVARARESGGSGSGRWPGAQLPAELAGTSLIISLFSGWRTVR